MDPRFDRRQFARAASSGLALFAVPGWFSGCQSVRREGPQDDDGGLTRLVLKVSDHLGTNLELGEFFGIFLLHASDAELALLATCDLTCAPAEELARDGLPLDDVHAILRVPGEAPVVALSGEFPYRTYTGDLPGEPEAEWDGRVFEERFERRSAIQHAWIAEQLARVLGPGSLALTRGCARERAAHGELRTDARPSLRIARSTPCLAIERASHVPQERGAWEMALARAVRERWSHVSPAGSSWVTETGCGLRYENAPIASQYGITCGMGYVPSAARRFLCFYTAEQRAAFEAAGWPEGGDSDEDTEGR